MNWDSFSSTWGRKITLEIFGGVLQITIQMQIGLQNDCASGTQLWRKTAGQFFLSVI